MEPGPTWVAGIQWRPANFFQTMKSTDEQHRSHLVERYCPYVARKILGFITYRFVPAGFGEHGENPLAS